MPATSTTDGTGPSLGRALALAVGLLALTGAVALAVGDRPAAGLERDLTRWARQLPGPVIEAFGPPMELGTVDVAIMGAVLVLIGFGLGPGIRALATVLLVAEASPTLKQVVDRPRLTPTELGDVPLEALRSSAYPSSHTAVAVGLAVAILLVDRRWGRIALALAAVVAVGRLVIGVHTLADLVGGAALGAAVALLVHVAAQAIALGRGRLRARHR